MKALNKKLPAWVAWFASSMTLLAQPAITNQPANQTVVLGSKVTFSVTAPGAGPFTYQWQFNSNNLPNGVITTVAGKGKAGFSGDGGPATNASLNGINGLAIDACGNLFITDNNRIRKIDTNGIITTVAGGGNGTGNAATNASLSPGGVEVDASGNLFIADTGNNRICKVNTNGIIATIAGGGSHNPGDGGAATNATLNTPYDLAVDAAGSLFIADSYNYRIRQVDTNGIITTVAGKNNFGFSGDGGPATNATFSIVPRVAVDAMGNIFVVDQINNRIRKVATNGIVTTVAGGGVNNPGDGGAATNATLAWPDGIAFDALGNMFIGDNQNHRVRKVDTNGIITTVAGNGSAGYSGDGGQATSAQLAYPVCVAFDSTGSLYVVDNINECIRKVVFTGLPTLTINNATTNDAGNYSVVITDASGSVTSSVASLTVVLPPRNFSASPGANGMRLQGSGTPNYPYILQSATNLTPPVNWQPVFTNPADISGNWQFTDTNLNASQKFYRAAVQ